MRARGLDNSLPSVGVPRPALWSGSPGNLSPIRPRCRLAERDPLLCYAEGLRVSVGSRSDRLNADVGLEPCRGGLSKASWPAVPLGPGWGKERSDGLCSLCAHFKASIFSTESELQEKLEVALGGSGSVTPGFIVSFRVAIGTASALAFLTRPCRSLHCSAMLRVMRCHG